MDFLVDFINIYLAVGLVLTALIIAFVSFLSGYRGTINMFRYALSGSIFDAKFDATVIVFQVVLMIITWPVGLAILIKRNLQN